jgi:hypothetical protein
MNPAIQIIKTKFKQKTITLEQLKGYVNNGTLTKRDILLFEFFPSRSEFEQAFPVTKSEHIAEMKKGLYTDAQIKDLLAAGIMSEQDLLDYGVKSKLELDLLFDRKAGYYDTDFDFSDVPPIREDRTDIFVFGIAGSGKSSFMAGLMYYMHKNGLLVQHMNNMVGYVYMYSLINTVQLRELPKPTAVNYVQYMECDLSDRQGRTHPLTFIEMSGELFSNLFGKPKSALNPKLDEYLFKSTNNKVIFLTIDYNAHLSGSAYVVRQDAKFNFILQFLDHEGMMNTVESICILITKWDSNIGHDPNAAENLLKDEYLTLYNQCKLYESKYSLKFRVFCYSLGRFNATNRYEYDDSYSKLLYEYLAHVTPVHATQKGNSVFKRLFGRKD